MPEIEYEFQLDGHGLDWYRFRIVTDRGHVVLFTTQYETTVDGRRVPVVRYDNAHGFAHRDRLNRRGDVIEKSPFAEGLTPAQALNIDIRDIRSNWRKYRQDFFGESS
jgi:hypothetical protein